MKKSRSSVKFFGFPSEERLKKRDSIRVVFEEGKIVSVAGARLFYMPNAGVKGKESCGKAGNRIAFVFSRKFGKAVARNRARRLGREAYRHLRTQIKPGYDLVLLVYPDEKANFAKRLEQLRSLLKKAKLLRQDEND